MRLVDSHVHLQDYGLRIDVPEVVSQAAEAGVSLLVCNGTNENDWRTVLDYAGRLPGVLPCLGLHPWFVSERSCDWFSILEELVQTTNCGIGETGLDRLSKDCNKPLQEESFRLQLELARRYERPVMVHCVRAWGWLMDVLRSEASLPSGMLIHSYGGSVDLIKPLSEMGAYFSFSGKVLFEDYAQSRRSLTAVPIDRLLLETDAPNMLPPERFRSVSVLSSEGKELNHPANLPTIMNGIADFLGLPPDELQEILWQNAGRFFGPLKTHQEL